MRQRVVSLIGLCGLVLLATSVPAEPQANEPSVRFTAAGDFSSSSAAAAVLDTIDDLNPDLHLAVGDLSYGTTGAEQAWCDFVTQRVGAGFPFQLIAGNHESNGQNGNINDFSACLPNQLPGAVGTYGRQYYADVPQAAPLVRFVQISPGVPFADGVWSYAAGSARYNWTAAAIDGARAAGIPWVVIGMHTPCLTVGPHSCDPGIDIFNLLVAKRVDLVLTGHDHLYARSKQLALGAGCPALAPNSYTAACVANAGNNLAKGAGTVIATVGTGGNTLYSVNTADSEYPYFAATSGLQNATWGVLDVTTTANLLTANFRRAAGGSFTDAFTITRDTAPNTPPTARLSTSCTNLSCAFDGSASTDGDGTIVSYAWDFGDSTAGSGATANHTYAAQGTYPVTLTVTDDDGAVGSATTQVSVTTSGTVTYAADDFSRTVTGGFGTAPVGGTWSVTGTASSYSVSGGSARASLPTAGSGRGAYLNAVSALNVDLTCVLALDKVANGNGVYLSIEARRAAGGAYRAKLKIASTGAVQLSLVRTNSSGTETIMAPTQTLPGLSYAVGDRLRVSTQALGSSPTQLRVKVWKDGTAEPATWQATVTDSTAALQAAGSIGFFYYLSGSATNAPVTVLLDDVVAAQP